MNYYNEIDPFAAAWLQALIVEGHIPPGEVDERSIADVLPVDLIGYRQCHFFAGIGGWPLALSLAGWPADRPVWTGSCPCQPFSVAGEGKGYADERHLWPALHCLVAECRPATVLGEQVAGKAGREWLAGIRADLEALGYAVGAADLCAASVGAPHIRQRLFWVASSDTNRTGCQDSGGRTRPEAPRTQRLVTAQHVLQAWSPQWGEGLVSEPGNNWLVDGLSANVGAVRAYGNAIVPQVAAEFVTAFLEAEKVGAMRRF